MLIEFWFKSFCEQQLIQRVKIGNNISKGK